MAPDGNGVVAALLRPYPDDVPGFGETPNARNDFLGT